MLDMEPSTTQPWGTFVVVRHTLDVTLSRSGGHYLAVMEGKQALGKAQHLAVLSSCQALGP